MCVCVCVCAGYCSHKKCIIGAERRESKAKRINSKTPWSLKYKDRCVGG